MTVGVSAYAPFNTSYELRTPYLTTTEYQAAPTAMDVSNLVSGGPAQQTSALQETIGRASSWIDQYTCGAWGTLCATQNVENARVWGNRMGQIVVHPNYWQILSVDAFSYSPIGYGFANATASITPSGNVWIEPQQFVVQPTGITRWQSLGATGVTTSEYFCEWTYTNGWPNTSLSASVDAGAESITPVSVTGLYPGSTVTIYDLPNDEMIQVASSYTVGASVVPLTTPLQYFHDTTATVTNLPPAIKQAAILATTAFIKQRGSGALQVADMGAVTHVDSGFSQNSGDDWYQAMELIKPFIMRAQGSY